MRMGQSYSLWSYRDKQQLLNLVETSKSQGKIDWQSVQNQFPERTINQLKSMYTALNRKKQRQNYKWKPEETYILFAHVIIYGKNWANAKFLEHLTSEQKRLKYRSTQIQLQKNQNKQMQLILKLLNYRLQLILKQTELVIPFELLVNTQLLQIANMQTLDIEKDFLTLAISLIQKLINCNYNKSI
ncbi:Myb-like_DNA-binding domain-containing protein [Hexamita inflata]|uniref:Myb-like DNA-binding domain-containing protein n=1 Tax=Hexamita inflata TaxID=28002 RepID=A0AA86PI94_9EUKA|nr:Myb-like DNA-binding domain-containing protein [Hexamita inflata]CAI9939541.1 Myb-like DNA-binding domain-containing protein [Hexamita inflata]